MATYNPPLDLLQRQLDSIRAQTHENWICFISDDCSPPDAHAALLREVGGDPRFAVSRSSQRLGFYRNFERALAMAGPDAEFVAMADQDDDWHPDKLAVLIGAIGSAQLVYSDARVVVARRRADLGHVVEPAHQQPFRPPLAAGRQRRHRSRLAAPS